MACNKLLLVGLLFAGSVIASWAVIFLLLPCPLPAFDGGSAASPSSDTDSFCIPDWDYLPHGAFYFLVGGFLGWIALKLYDYFAADDEAIRAAIARKLLAVGVLFVGDILVAWALILAVPDVLRSYGCADLGAGFTCDNVVFLLLGVLTGCADLLLYYRFSTSCGHEAKMVGYLAIRGEPEAGKI